MFEAYIHTRSNIHAQTYTLEAFKHTRLRASNIHTRPRDSNIHTYTLEGSNLHRPWKLKKSSFEQALQNASKPLQKLRFGHTVWSRQDI